jgi:hypothetical protein
MELCVCGQGESVYSHGLTVVVNFLVVVFFKVQY